MNIWSEITGAILAGGKSSRMGKNKALLDLNGKPFIQHIAETLSKVFDEVIIIANHGAPYKFLQLPIYEDVLRECGSLGGIHSALMNAATERVFIISCDMPLVSAELIEYLISHQGRHSTITVPIVENRLQPLCGVYKAECLGALVDYLGRGERHATEFVRTADPTVVPLSRELLFFHPMLFADVDTVEDYERIKSGIRADIGN